jgi:hypothetical protein
MDPFGRAGQSAKNWTSKDFPNISKLRFGDPIDINDLFATKFWTAKDFPNFYRAGTGDIKALRAKKLGNCSPRVQVLVFGGIVCMFDG